MNANACAKEEPAARFDVPGAPVPRGSFSSAGMDGGAEMVIISTSSPPKSVSIMAAFDHVKSKLSSKPLRRPAARGPAPTARQQAMSAAEEFLVNLYDLSARNLPRKASDYAFDFFEGHFESGRFAVGSEILKRLDVDRVSETVLVAILAVTAPARERMAGDAYTELLDRARHSLIRRCGPEETAAILKYYQ